LFLVEGLQLVGAAIENGWLIEALLYAPELLSGAFGQRVVEEFSGRREEVAATVFGALTGKDNPQGILAIVKRPQRSLVDLLPSGSAAAIVSPQDPGNVGTVLRTLDAVGGSALYLLDGGVDPYHPTAIRAAMGSTFTVPAIEASFEDFRSWCRTNAVQLIGSSAHAATSYRQVQTQEPWILLLGSEQKGLNADHQAACKWVVALPMRGRASSLNLAVAAGVLLFGLSGLPSAAGDAVKLS
jgi:TrmH family RNA methyltransferase